MSDSLINSADHNHLANKSLSASVSPSFPLVPSGAQSVRPNASNLSPALVWYAVRRWLIPASLSGLLIGGVATLAIFMLVTPKFRATAWLRLHNNKPWLAFAEGDGGNSYRKTQLEIMKSPVVLGRVLADPQIASDEELVDELDPYQWLRDHISVSTVQESELVQVTCEAKSAAFASAAANLVMDTYVLLQREVEDRQRQEVIVRLREEQGRRRTLLNTLQTRLRGLAKQAGTPVVGNDRIVLDLSNPLSALQQRLASAEVERTLLTAERDSLLKDRDAKPESISPEQLDALINEAPAVQQLTADLQGLRLRRERVAQAMRIGEKSAEVQRLDKSIAALEERLVEVRKEIGPALKEAVLDSWQAEQSAALGAIQKKIGREEAVIALVKNQLEAARRELELAGDSSLEIEYARTELAREESVFERISERIIALTTEQSAPGRVEILERASVPVKPVDNGLIKKLGLGGLAGFFLPFALAVLWEVRAKRVARSEQLAGQSFLPILAEISVLPRVTRRTSSRISGQQLQIRSIYEESINQLKTTLTISDDLREVRVIAVSSAISGEGKTTVASHLAHNLARSTGDRVLLVDCDMRKPSVHELFDVPLEPGLADCLGGNLAIDDAVTRTGDGGPFVLPAGVLSQSPHTLASPARIQALLANLRARFTYIILDCPPLLSAGEAFVFAKAADGALVCVMRDVSRVDQVKSACDRLAGRGIRSLGVVLNGIPTKAYQYSYGPYQYTSS